jgi:hypothetical protein
MLTVLTYPPDFQVDAVLCDSAVTADGKLYIQRGGWNLLGAESFPFRQSRIADRDHLASHEHSAESPEP